MSYDFEKRWNDTFDKDLDEKIEQALKRFGLDQEVIVDEKEI